MDQPPIDVNQPPKKSGGVLKWILIGCGGLFLIGALIVGIGAYLLSRAINMDPQKVETEAQDILKFDKPAGFKGEFSASVGVKMAVLTAPNEGHSGQSSIMLMAFPGAVTMSAEDMQRQMREAMLRQGRGGDQEVSTRRPSESFKVRGDDSEAQVSELAAGNGAVKSLQYALTVKNASGALVLVMITGPESFATHEWVQQFLDSVK